MIDLQLTQGSDEWLAARTQYRCASDAPAIMGFDKRTSRAEFLRMKAAGNEREFSEWAKRNLLAKGHEVEALARPIAGEIIGEELFPVIGCDDSHTYLASLDGLTLLGDTPWENKMLNQELLSYIVTHQDLPETHWPQVEQQLFVTGAERALFTVSDGTKEGTTPLWYESKPERRQLLLAAWDQFDADLANYQHVEVAVAPTAAPIKELPALTVQLVGSVTASNLAEWQAVVTGRIQAINTDLKTDQDFADAALMVNFLDEGEKKLELVKEQALAQTASIDALFRAIDSIKAEMRTKRLDLDKTVTKRKETIRIEIAQEAYAGFAEHIEALNKRLGSPLMSIQKPDFAGAMKGKRTVQTCRDAVSDALATAKSEATIVADRIAINQKAAAETMFLFPDFASVCTKANDDFATLLIARVQAHNEAEQKRLDAEREKIRAEEAAKAQAEAAQAIADAAKAQEVAAPVVQEVAKPAVVEEAKPGNVTPRTSALGRPSRPSVRQQLDEAINAMNEWQLTDLLAYAIALKTKAAA